MSTWYSFLLKMELPHDQLVVNVCVSFVMVFPTLWSFFPDVIYLVLLDSSLLFFEAAALHTFELHCPPPVWEFESAPSVMFTSGVLVPTCCKKIRPKFGLSSFCSCRLSLQMEFCVVSVSLVVTVPVSGTVCWDVCRISSYPLFF